MKGPTIQPTSAHSPEGTEVWLSDAEGLLRFIRLLDVVPTLLAVLFVAEHLLWKSPRIVKRGDTLYVGPVQISRLSRRVGYRDCGSLPCAWIRQMDNSHWAGRYLELGLTRRLLYEDERDNLGRQEEGRNPEARRKGYRPELDDERIGKMEDVLEIYKKPYDPAEPAVCFDEKPVALHAGVRAPRPAKPGRKSPGTTNISGECQARALAVG